MNDDSADVFEQTFQMWLKKLGTDIDAAEAKVAQLAPWAEDLIASIAQRHRDQALVNKTMTFVPDAQKNKLASQNDWYSGPLGDSPIWNQLHRKLSEKLPTDAVRSIDVSSTEVVSHLAAPTREGKVKGLVVGYVQSGKTANYASVIAKAADAGYRLVIVLAGMHNNLRRQTQLRLLDDLGGEEFWTPLTDADSDFGINTPAKHWLSSSDNLSLAVVKKNGSRLRKLKNWLKDTGSGLDQVPVLLIDDEADQATPNTSMKKDLSAINKKIRQIWGLIKRGSYVGYTATPFANVFMDPDDDEELYPSDFIRQLPISQDYFGAAQLFGRFAVDDADEPDDGLNVAREVPPEDASLLMVQASNREDWSAHVVPSLAQAVRWFVLATATRRVRGQRDHSSMLVHFTHFTQPHFAMRDALERWIKEETRRLVDGNDADYQALWLAERPAASLSGLDPRDSWAAVRSQLVSVVHDVQVVVDNGSSDDRLDYTSSRGVDSDPQTVIAVGGGTLSRGLTLEGLVVSYFTRTSNTYDTLLQMGRWFGYRPGYEDLPRIWMTDGLLDDFRFLAAVEEELRRTIDEMVNESRTPAEVGVKIRSHPGRLQITSRAKMQHAQKVQASLSGEVVQTFILNETDRYTLRANLAAARGLVAGIGAAHFQPAPRGGAGRLLATDVEYAHIQRFFREYQSEPVGAPNVHLISEWFDRYPSPLWNVGIVGGPVSAARSVDLGLVEPTACVTRRPLSKAPTGIANIKALISQPDIVTDIPQEAGGRETARSYKGLRNSLRPAAKPLLLIYPIDGQAPAPTDPTSRYFITRRGMHAPDGLALIGYALCLPTVDDERFSANAEYFAVRPTAGELNDWGVTDADADAEIADERDWREA